MAKYRLLTRKELEHFEKEFIEYLVVNGITGDDWKKMKQEASDKAESITDLFSDVVFEKIMRNVQFLTFTSAKRLFAFQCLPKELVLIAMNAENDSDADFTDKELLETYLVQPPISVKIFTQSKKYEKSRELELFKMTEEGCTIDEGAIFKALSLAL